MSYVSRLGNCKVVCAGPTTRIPLDCDDKTKQYQLKGPVVCHFCFWVIVGRCRSAPGAKSAAEFAKSSLAQYTLQGPIQAMTLADVGQKYLSTLVDWSVYCCDCVRILRPVRRYVVVDREGNSKIVLFGRNTSASPHHLVQ